MENGGYPTIVTSIILFLYMHIKPVGFPNSEIARQ